MVLLVSNKPIKVISVFTIINSLSKTYPPKRVTEFSLIIKVSAGDSIQIMGTNRSFTFLDFRNNPKAYNPKSGP